MIFVMRQYPSQTNVALLQYLPTTALCLQQTRRTVDMYETYGKALSDESQKGAQENKLRLNFKKEAAILFVYL